MICKYEKHIDKPSHPTTPVPYHKVSYPLNLRGQHLLLFSLRQVILRYQLYQFLAILLKYVGNLSCTHTAEALVLRSKCRWVVLVRV